MRRRVFDQIDDFGKRRILIFFRGPDVDDVPDVDIAG